MSIPTLDRLGEAVGYFVNVVEGAHGKNRNACDKIIRDLALVRADLLVAVR